MVLVALSISSCSNYYTYNSKRTTSLTPDFVRLDVSLSDFEYLGQTEISVQTRKYLGVIQVIDSINNRLYNYRDVRLTNLQGKGDIRLSGEMRRAAYKVIDEFPEATYYIISSDYAQVNRLFLGRRVNRRMEIQAFKYSVESN